MLPFVKFVRSPKQKNRLAERKCTRGSERQSLLTRGDFLRRVWVVLFLSSSPSCALALLYNLKLGGFDSLRSEASPSPDKPSKPPFRQRISPSHIRKWILDGSQLTLFPVAGTVVMESFLRR